jgi:hypothetical protein
MAFKVQNWPEYEAGLRRRGSLTLWIQDAALNNWQTVGPGGQARPAIPTMLIVRAAFRLALRQTEGLLASVITLMGLTISAPDHSTMSVSPMPKSRRSRKRGGSGLWGIRPVSCKILQKRLPRPA